MKIEAPREFWLWNRPKYFTKCPEHYPEQYFCVIEKSAFDAQAAELEAVRKERDEHKRDYLTTVGCLGSCHERENILTAKLAQCVEALDDLLNDTQHKDHNCGDENCPVDKAREVLGKVKGEV